MRRRTGIASEGLTVGADDDDSGGVDIWMAWVPAGTPGGDLEA